MPALARLMGEGYCGCREKAVTKAVPILGTARVCPRCGVGGPQPLPSHPAAPGRRSRGFPSPCWEPALEGGGEALVTIGDVILERPWFDILVIWLQ